MLTRPSPFLLAAADGVRPLRGPGGRSGIHSLPHLHLVEVRGQILHINRRFVRLHPLLRCRACRARSRCNLGLLADGLDILLRGRVQLVLCKDGIICDIAPHRVHHVVLRLALVAIEDLLTGLRAGAASSHVFLDVNLTLHSAFGRRQVLEDLVIPLILSDTKGLLDDVLLLVVWHLDMQWCVLSELLSKALLGREVSVIGSQERPLLDHLRGVAQRVFVQGFR